MRNLLFVLIFLIVEAGTGFAYMRSMRDVLADQPVFGIVQSTSRNTIEIFDEREKRRRRFIYTGHVEEFHPGQRVQIEYGGGMVIKTIIKMSSSPYDVKNNHGYFGN